MTTIHIPTEIRAWVISFKVAWRKCRGVTMKLLTIILLAAALAGRQPQPVTPTVPPVIGPGPKAASYHNVLAVTGCV